MLTVCRDTTHHSTGTKSELETKAPVSISALPL